MNTELNAIQVFARMIADRNLMPGEAELDLAASAFADTIACIIAGSQREITINILQAVSKWGQGDSGIVGHELTLAAPFAAMVNAAAGHALDFDDYDLPANAHPSVVIFPALMAIIHDEPLSGVTISGRRFLDAYIIGLEVMQRLGECMNMTHYRKGWLTTVTLGSIAAAAACARLNALDQNQSEAALSLACSMASGLTNQGGFTAKQLNPGIAAKNGVMAEALARCGVTANNAAIDGTIGIAGSMGNYESEKFAKALAKVASPWSIQEFGVYTKPYPSCGYTGRIIDAAIALHSQLTAVQCAQIESIEIAIPDYYLDLLIYPLPQNVNQAMFSAEYAVAFALIHGEFGFTALQTESIDDRQIQALCKLSRIIVKTPIDADSIYDPQDPDYVNILLKDQTSFKKEIGNALGSPKNPLSNHAIRQKFEHCAHFANFVTSDQSLWTSVSTIKSCGNTRSMLDLLKPS